LYVDSRRVNDALLLLLDHANRLSPNTVELVRTDSRYHVIREDPRFTEVIGPIKAMPVGKEVEYPRVEYPGVAPVVPDKDTFPPEVKPPFPSDEQNIKSGKMRFRPVAERPRPVARKELQSPAGDATLNTKAPWVLSGVLFDFDRSTIKLRFRSMLDRAVAVLKKNPALHVEVQGHTDGRGSAVYNQRLSKRRAMAVMRYFVGKGVRRERLSAKGLGESNPVDSNATEAGRARNRRVELKAKEAEIFAAR
jgi:outer membrane protein OmpA-like peptidoglycan-associated protein